jgi:stalled ribosome alternative rescue factor ArfA
MGGSDEPSNLIELTIEEHAEAHRKLWEDHGNEYDRIAWLSLTKQIDNAEARILSVIEWNKNRIISDETKEKMSDSMKEYYSIPENREKASESTKKGMKDWWDNLSEDERQDWITRCKKRPDGWIPPSGWTYNHTEEAKEAIRQANLNKVLSEETKQKVSRNRKGKGTGERNAMSNEENRKKVSQSKIGRKRVYQPDGSFKYIFPDQIG